MFSLSATVWDICSSHMHNVDLDLYNGPRSNTNIPIESQQLTSYMLEIIMFALLVTIYKMITFNLSKWSRYWTVDLQKCVTVKSYNVANYIVGWRFMANKMVKTCEFISNRFPLVHQRGVVYIYIYIYIDNSWKIITRPIILHVTHVIEIV